MNNKINIVVAQNFENLIEHHKASVMLLKSLDKMDKEINSLNYVNDSQKREDLKENFKFLKHKYEKNELKIKKLWRELR